MWSIPHGIKSVVRDSLENLLEIISYEQECVYEPIAFV